MAETKIKISPSILAADFARLGEDVKDVCQRGIDYLHIDVMDGIFVPNISFGPSVMKSLDEYTSVPYDVHLMIDEPIRYIDEFATDNTEFITVHYEACSNPEATLDAIHKLGLKAGISIKPGTDPEATCNLLNKTDMVLVMSVEPGFGGQEFMDTSLAKIEYYYNKRKEADLNYLIEVDGGISSQNAHLVRNAGVDVIVAGSAVFKASDRTLEIEGIKG